MNSTTMRVSLLFDAAGEAATVTVAVTVFLRRAMSTTIRMMRTAPARMGQFFPSQFALVEVVADPSSVTADAAELIML
jgi:hypothetical protein